MRSNFVFLAFIFLAGLSTSAHGQCKDSVVGTWRLVSVTASTDRPTGNLIEDEPGDVQRYMLMFTHLQAAALSPAQSLSLIGDAIGLL